MLCAWMAGMEAPPSLPRLKATLSADNKPDSNGYAVLPPNIPEVLWYPETFAGIDDSSYSKAILRLEGRPDPILLYAGRWHGGATYHLHFRLSPPEPEEQ